MAAVTLDELIADLNEPQRRAVLHRDGPLLVLAGPGSGKTRVITHRAAALVRGGVWASRILAITFTNKAAAEMRSRIAALGVERSMWVCTFHALGVRLLRELGPLAGVRPGFTIYDEADQLRCLKDAMAACAVSPELHRPESVAAKISAAKNKLQTPADFAERADFFGDRLIGRVYEAYQQILEQRNAVDFDDLLMRVALLLRDRPEVAERLNERFRYLLIDEYQDTNHAQYLIARHLSKHHRNICATGDPDQSIYGWRGADIGNILDFERDYPDAVVVRLEQNYRSTGAILRVADRLIAANKKRKAKRLWTENAEGEPPVIWECEDDRAEAAQVAEAIAAQRRAGRQPGDFAVFYRINALSRGLEEALRRQGIPYRIARGVEFYNRREIKDVLAYLRVLLNPADRVSLERIINTPPRGLGKTTLDRLGLAADETGRPLLEVLRRADELPGLKAAPKIRAFVALLERMEALLAAPVSAAVSGVLEMSGLEAALKAEDESAGEDRLANVQELVTAARLYEQDSEEPTLEGFLQHVSLVSDQDAVDDQAGCVMLMTLHTAKGLEFPVVFIVGVEEGLLPHERGLQSASELEEERRLCFVGITRARERLHLSYARQRLLRGMLTPRSASQFLYQFPREAVRWEQPEDAGEAGAARWGSDSSEFDDEPASRLPSGRYRVPPRRRDRDFHDERTFSKDEPTLPPVPPPPDSPYRDWKPGQLVQHTLYGPGQLMSIHPAPGQTRAVIRFPRLGEKTFILEKAPVQKLAR